MQEFLNRHNIDYKIQTNPKRILASGWNIAIKAARYPYVCRIDAHSTIPTNYIKKTLAHLKNLEKNIAGIGGVLINKSETIFGNIACDFYQSVLELETHHIN